MTRKKEEFGELICGSYICAKTRNSINISEKGVKAIFQSKIAPFSKSGGYISAPQKFCHHKVYVIVMEEKEKDAKRRRT